MSQACGAVAQGTALALVPGSERMVADEHRPGRRHRPLDAGEVAVAPTMSVMAVVLGAALFTWQHFSCSRDEQGDALFRPFRRHAPQADSSQLRLSALAGTLLRLPWDPGRHGRAVRHAPPARFPRLGAAATCLPRYSRHGAGFWRDAWWQLHCRLDLNIRPISGWSSGSPMTAFYACVERTWMLQQSPWALLFFAIGGLSFVVWGISVRVTVCVTGHWLIGHFAHRQAINLDRRWRVGPGYDIPFAGFITMGEASTTITMLSPVGQARSVSRPDRSRLVADQELRAARPRLVRVKTPADLPIPARIAARRTVSAQTPRSCRFSQNQQRAAMTSPFPASTGGLGGCPY